MKRKYYQSDWDDLVKAYSKNKILAALKYNLECLHESYIESKNRNEDDSRATQIATLSSFMHDGCVSLAVLGYAFSNDTKIEDIAVLTCREIFENYAQAAHVFLSHSSNKYKDSAEIFESMYRLIQIDWVKRLDQLDYELKEFIADLKRLTNGRPFVTTIFDVYDMNVDMASDDTNKVLNELLKMILLTDLSNVLNSYYMSRSIIQKRYVKPTKNALEYAMNPDMQRQIVKYAVVMHNDGLIEAFTIWLKNIPEFGKIIDFMKRADDLD